MLIETTLLFLGVIQHTMASAETDIEPRRCPFCGAELASPGAGFVRHVEDAPDCRDAFETWRDRVTDDMRGGWAG